CAQCRSCICGHFSMISSGAIYCPCVARATVVVALPKPWLRSRGEKGLQWWALPFVSSTREQTREDGGQHGRGARPVIRTYGRPRRAKRGHENSVSAGPEIVRRPRHARGCDPQGRQECENASYGRDRLSDR